jgi:hypothetical protein
MRSITKTVLRTCAGLAAAAALVAGGAGVASAATTSPATHSASRYGYGCNPYARESWNLNGSNTVAAVYKGNTYNYSVTFKQYGSCLSGTLTDTYYSGTATGPIYGTINGNHVTFSFKYPAGSVQGTRTFNGYIQAKFYRQWYWQRGWHFHWVYRVGSVSGTWSETGTEQGSGTFTLANNVRSACPTWEWWARSCVVY